MCGILESKEESVSRIREQTALSNAADRPSKMNGLNGIWHFDNMEVTGEHELFSRKGAGKSLTGVGSL